MLDIVRARVQNAHMKTNEMAELGNLRGVRVSTLAGEFGYDLGGIRYQVTATDADAAILVASERALSQHHAVLDVRSVRRVAGREDDWWVTLNVKVWK